MNSAYFFKMYINDSDMLLTDILPFFKNVVGH